MDGVAVADLLVEARTRRHPCRFHRTRADVFADVQEGLTVANTLACMSAMPAPVHRVLKWDHLVHASVAARRACGLATHLMHASYGAAASPATAS